MAEGSPLILLLVVSIMLSVFSVGLGATPGAALRFMQQPIAVGKAMAAMFLAMLLLAILAFSALLLVVASWGNIRAAASPVRLWAWSS